MFESDSAHDSDSTDDTWSADGVDYTTSNDRTWSILAHVLGLAGALTSIPFGGCIAPLAIWLSQRDRDAATEHHARAALNFQLTVSIAYAAGLILTLLTLGIGAIIAIPGLFLLAIYAAVMSIMSAVNASNDRMASYPLSLHLVQPYRPIA